MLVMLTGCSYYFPSIMLRTPKNYDFDKLSDSTKSVSYKIAPNDIIGMRMFSQDGFHLVDLTNTSVNVVTTSASSGGSNPALAINAEVQYLVQNDGTVDLPVVKKVEIAGLTVREATELLEKKYSTYFVKPFVLMDITNMRVIVFPGDPGTAKIIPLVNNNTTLIEAIATAGGITEDGKAKQIILIRRTSLQRPQIYKMDLSSIAGLKEANTILQANDIIYVSTQRRLSQELLIRVTPFLSLVTSIILTYLLIKDTKL